MSLPSVDDPGVALPHITLQTVIGISVSIAGNVLISLALNLQKLAHLRLRRRRESSLPDAERPPGRDQSTRHLINPGATARFGAAQQTLEEQGNQQFERQPLIPRRSPSQHPPSTYGFAQYNATVSGDDTVSRKSSTATRPRRGPRKQSFVQHLLSLRSMFGSDSQDPSSARTNFSDCSTMPVGDVFPQRNARTNHQTKTSSPTTVEDEKESDYLRSRLWWSGFILMNVGEIGNFISYAFAPASVVAPLGTFALVANCFFAPLLLHERFRPRDIFGILLAVIGATTVVFSSSDDGAPPVLTPEALLEAVTQRHFVVFSIIYLVLAVILGCLSEGSMGRRLVVIDIGLCAIFGGFTVLATKAISTLLTKEWVRIVTEWITYPILAVLVITGILQIRYLNRALKRFDSKIVIPTQFVFFTLSAVVGSAVLYGDFRQTSFHEFVTFLYGCAATFAGVFVIASSPSENTNESVHDEERRDPGGRREAASRIDGAGSPGTQGHPAQGTPRTGARDIPVLRHRQSTVSLVGYTPMQSFLLAHTPPVDGEGQSDRERERESRP